MATNGIMGTTGVQKIEPLTAEKAQTTGYGATGYGATGYGATGYNSTGYESKQRTVDPAKETVQGQMTGIMASGSPLLTMAKTGAKQSMNDRGLLNSSIGVQAGEAAVLQSALPIAQQDASTYSATASQNQQLADTASQFNASAKNTEGQFNATSTNEANKFNAASTNESQQFNAASSNEAGKFNATAANANAQFNASEQNKLGQQAMDSNTKIALQQMSNESAQNLAQVEANYKMLMQSSASASDYYKQIVKNMTDIMANASMNATAKTTAINNQIQMLETGLGTLGEIGNLDLTGLLDFSGLPGSSETTGGAAPAPTQPGGTPAYGNDWGQITGNRSLPKGFTDLYEKNYQQYLSGGGNMTPQQWYKSTQQNSPIIGNDGG